MGDLSRCLCPHSKQKTWTKKKPKHEEEEERESTPVRETSAEQMEESFDLTPTTPIGRGRPKLVRNRDLKSPGANNLKLHVDNMNEQQLEQAIETITGNLTTTTIVENTGNENQIKTEINETPNINELDKKQSTN